VISSVLPLYGPTPSGDISRTLDLHALGALDEEGLLTTWTKMAEFPLEPNLSKMLILSVDRVLRDPYDYLHAFSRKPVLSPRQAGPSGHEEA
jgi:HrpA-like RNA helicase